MVKGDSNTVVRTKRRYATPTMNEVAKRWSDNEDAKAHAPYETGDEHGRIRKRPTKVWKSRSACRSHFRQLAIDYEAAGDKPRSREKMSIADMTDLMIKHAHFTAYDDGSTKALYMYDYDSGIYIDPVNIIDELIVALTNHTTRQTKTAVLDTILARSDELMVYRPLPKHKIALGNGIYNLITGTFEDFDPIWTTMNKIDTEYHPEALTFSDDEQFMFDGITFDSMCNSFANGNRERIRLLEEICKAVVVGFDRRAASIFVVGEGGDGKSTFFERMLGATIGHKNVAQLGLDDLSSDDKLLLCESKKLILGTDNRNDVFINDDTRFKQLSTHDRILVSRKYLDARSLLIKAVMIQLCNTFPRFHSTNNSITRRIVPLKAENRYVVKGVDDENIVDVVSSKRFSEHVLAAILDKPYRIDFNTCDMDLLDESAAINDIIGQFIEELVSAGVLDERTLAIPQTHLYAAYIDWLELKAPNERALNSKTFTNRIKSYLNKFGFSYKVGSDNPPVRPNSTLIAKNYHYTASIFDGMALDEHFQKAVNNNQTSRFFIRTEEDAKKFGNPNLSMTIHRDDYDCSVYEYLGIEREICNFMNSDERKRYAEECREIEENGVVSEPTESEKDDGKRVLMDFNELPCDAAYAFRNGKNGDLKRLRAWLNRVGSGNAGDEWVLNALFDKLQNQLAMIAKNELQDTALMLSIESINSAGSIREKSEISVDCVDSLIKKLEESDKKGGR